MKHVDDINSLASTIFAFQSARDDSETSILTKGINRLLTSRFKRVELLSKRNSQQNDVDLTMVLDLQINIGSFSFTETSVKITGIFFDQNDMQIDIIESLGVKTVPYPATNFQFKQASDTALELFADQLDRSDKLAQNVKPLKRNKIAKTSNSKSRQKHNSNYSLQAKLTVKSSPAGAHIRILNIVPKYKNEIQLKPGKYHIEVTKEGYQRHLQWISINELDRVVDVVLAKKVNTPLIENKSTLVNDHQSNSDISIINNIRQKRTALVIGNSNYDFSPLTNPTHDAKDIAALLKTLGFKVTLRVNATQEQMESSINEFGRTLSISGGIGLFYYAGHGVQIDGQNYLIPIGAKIKRQKDVRYKAVNLGQVLDEMGYARNGFNIALLDACRNNPLPRSFRSSTKGLARVASPDGTLIGFATSPGSTAADGEGRNGLYTKYLLKHIKTPDISVEEALKRVSRSVKKETNKKQSPWMESSFSGDFYFVRQ